MDFKEFAKYVPPSPARHEEMIGIDHLGMPTRIRHAIDALGIVDVQQVLTIGDRWELLDAIGKKTVRQLRYCCEYYFPRQEWHKF